MTAQGTRRVAWQRFNTRELRRVLKWGLSTAGALVVAVLLANTETGQTRLASASLELSRIVQAPRAEPEDQARKFTVAMQLLAADRDRLAARVDALERDLDEVTGSIERRLAAATAPPPAPAPPPPMVAPPEMTTGAPQPAPAPTMVVSTPPDAHEFGIDLGGAASIDSLRALWLDARSKHGGLLEGLRPLIVVRHRLRPAAVQLRLVVGPFATAAAASRLCSLIAVSGAFCQTAAFEGQQLALR